MLRRIGEQEYHILFNSFPILIIILILVLTSGCLSLTAAYVPDAVLTDGWYENTSLRDTGSQSFGLEKWASATYEIQGDYPASLTVTTMKNLILMDEQELIQRINETISSTLRESITLNENTEITGERALVKGHKTRFMVYDGNETSGNQSNQFKIIGEVWNCGTSGTSIICIGVAQITDYNETTSSEDSTNWEKIVADPAGAINNIQGGSGLIYNVVCH